MSCEKCKFCKTLEYIREIAGCALFFTCLFGIFDLPYFGAAIGTMLGLHLVSKTMEAK